MRPAKLILLVGNNAKDLGALKYALATNRYRVIAEETAQSAIKVLPDLGFDLLLCQCPVENLDDMLASAKQICPRTPSIVLSEKAGGLPLTQAPDVCLFRPSMVELLERIKVMCARKRGPKPGSHRRKGVA